MKGEIGMKLLTKIDRRTEVEKELDRQLDELVKTAKDFRSYEQDRNAFIENCELVTKRNEVPTKPVKERKFKISGDALIGAGVTLLGILLVLAHESDGHIISTKAFGWIPRSRV